MQGAHAGTLLATSADALQWSKPALKLVEWNGTTDNNILISHTGVEGDLGVMNDGKQWRAFGCVSNLIMCVCIKVSWCSVVGL